MATKTRNYPPNANERKNKTAKTNECQLCHKKVALKDQYTVVNDLDAGKATKRKVGKREVSNLSHYCDDCAKKRVKQKEAWMASRNGDKPAKKSGSAKPAAKASSSGRGRKASGRSRSAGKAGRKPAAAKARASAKQTEEEPF